MTMHASRTAALLTTISGIALTAAALTGCSGQEPAPEPSSSQGSQESQGNQEATESAPTTQATPDEGTVGGPAEDADLATSPVPVSAEDAIATAKSEAADATVYSIDLEFERRHDTWVYSVDLQDQAKEYEIKIDAATNEVLASETEHAEEPEAAVSPSDPLPYADALKLAQDQGSGRLAGWSLEEDDGAVEYTFEFGDDPDDVDVVVDAKTERVYVDN
jgi:uncharacterized membrane protein YkoI